MHERSPNSALWDCFLVSSLEHCFKITITARSLHDSIVHAAMLDGSIRPISSQIEPRRWSALGGINDSESFIIDLALDVTLCVITVLHITTFSTFVSENSALGAKLIVAARSQGYVRLKRWFG